MGLDVAIMLEGQDGLNWERWRRIAGAAEQLGFAALYRSDHFTNASGSHRDALELWTSLTWLAGNTKRIQFGPMVSPVSFRHPVVTAWTAAAVDDLSGGRLQLGLGAGWQEREHHNYGFDLLDTGPRFQRFEEALQVVTTLLKSDAPALFNGHVYQLEDALLLPRPARAGGPPIVIGGNGPKLTLPLAARFADEWNSVYTTASRFAELSATLDGLLDREGRSRSAVRRTLMTRVVVGRDDAEAAAKFGGDVEAARAHGQLIGGPERLLESIQQLEVAGVQRLMAQWLDMDDMTGLELIAGRVIPSLAWP